MTKSAIYIGKDTIHKNDDVWKCWDCRARFRKKKNLQGTIDNCGVCGVTNLLDPLGGQPPLTF